MEGSNCVIYFHLTETMDKLIQIINQLQEYNRTYNLVQINIPEVVVLGSQSSGKSSVLERILGRDILPKGAKLSTRSPVILQMINSGIRADCDGAECGEGQDDLRAVFTDEPETEVRGVERIADKLQLLTNKIAKDLQGMSERPIIMTLYSATVPTLTMVDLPGTFQNDTEVGVGSAEMVRQLSERYAQKPYSIILAVSAANVDLANSDSIKIAHKFDPNGERTFHVITKLDLMDAGTDARGLLESQFVRRSLGTICVVNRSQQKVMNRQMMELTKEEEVGFFRLNYRDIFDQHGIDSLQDALVRKLKEQILVHLPSMTNEISERIYKVEEKLRTIDVTKDESILRKSVVRFVDDYSALIRGDRAHRLLTEAIEGGALISRVLYHQFRDEVERLGTKHLNREQIRTTIINTCGQKRTTFGIERPFSALIRAEIWEFKKPSIYCLNQIRDFLHEFVGQIIDELNVSDLTNFTSRLENEMSTFILRRYEVTREVIENLVKCEANDVYCPHPNSHFYESLQGKIETKMQEKKAEILAERVQEAMALHHDLSASVSSMIVIATKRQVLPALTKLLEGVDNVTIDEVTEILGDKIEDDEFITDLQATEDVIGLLNQAKTISRHVDRIELDKELDIDVIETMVRGYFDQVRQNIIYSVPKWIQTLLIQDLLEEIRDGLFPFIDSEREELMRLDPRLERSLINMQTELKDLKKIHENLWQFKR